MVHWIIVSSIVSAVAAIGKRSQGLNFKREMLMHGVPAAEIE
jgi:hypothetical protein